MPERNNLHVTKGDGCWNVKAEGEDTPVAQTRTQKEAIDAARQMLMDNPIGGEIMIHGRDGRIRDNRTINRKDNPYSKGSGMYGLHDDEERARRIGRDLRARRERDGLSLPQVAKQTGVSSGTIKRFEQFGAGELAGPFRYEPWGAEYLERWLDGTLTPEIRTKHDIQRILERDTSLSREQVKTLVAEMWAAYDRVSNH